MIKIGFIHFDDIYLIHHFIASAAELFNDPECDVDILTPETDQDYLYYLLSIFNVPNSIVKKLPTYIYKKIIYKIQGRTRPSHQYIFRKHMKKLLEYDVLVFTVFNHSHILRRGRKPKFVMLMHGAGDRDYPFLEIYKKPVSEFDLVTTSGQKINDLFYDMGRFNHTKFKICGYQKFDAIKIENNKKSVFNNKKPTVLYNPHFREYITSYYKYGSKILDFFYRNKEFNLVFSPHINLFDKQGRASFNKSIIDKKYYKSDNILIDLGSFDSVNMTYTQLADVYLGDLSSQVYEFLINGDKPCIFINSHNINWKEDKYYQTWHLGKVITDINDLEDLLNTRDIWQKDYKEQQKKAISYTFDISKEVSSSKRVATAIKQLVKSKI